MPNRRDFIKTSTAALALTALPITALAATEPYAPKPMKPYSEFNPGPYPSGSILTCQPKFYSPLHTPSYWGPHWGLTSSDKFKHNKTIFELQNPQINKHLEFIKSLCKEMCRFDIPWIEWTIEKCFVYGDIFLFNGKEFLKNNPQYNNFDPILTEVLEHGTWAKYEKDWVRYTGRKSNPILRHLNVPFSFRTQWEPQSDNQDDDKEIIFLTCKYNGLELEFNVTDYCEHVAFNPKNYNYNYGEGIFQHMRIPNTHGLYTEKNFEEVNAEELKVLKNLNDVINKKLKNRPSKEEIQNGAEDFYRGDFLDDEAYINWRSGIYAFTRRYEESYQKVFGGETHV